MEIEWGPKRCKVTGNQQDAAKKLYITFSLVPSLSSFFPNLPLALTLLGASFPRRPSIHPPFFKGAGFQVRPLINSSSSREETADLTESFCRTFQSVSAPRDGPGFDILIQLMLIRSPANAIKRLLREISHCCLRWGRWSLVLMSQYVSRQHRHFQKVKPGTLIEPGRSICR